MVVAAALHLFEALDLARADGGIVHFARLKMRLVFQPVFVDADNHRLAPVHHGLAPRRGFFDQALGQSGGDGFGHAAERLHLLDQRPGLVGQILRQALDIEGAGQRVHDIGDAGLVLQYQLRVAGDAGGEFGGKGDGFVEGIGVQRLRAAQHGGHGFESGAHDVVIRVLLLKRHA